MDNQDIINELRGMNLLLTNRVQALETTVLNLQSRLNNLESGLGETTVKQIPREDKRSITGIVISDSNRHNVNPAGLSFGERKSIIYPCSTLIGLPEVIKDRNSGEKICNPDTVLIHTGTNDWDSGDSVKVALELKKSIKSVKDMWPGAKVKVSSILQRRDRTKEQMDEINDQLKKTSDESDAEFCENIVMFEDLKDNKHLKDDKVYKIALAWKYALNPKETWTRKKKQNIGPSRPSQNVSSLQDFKNMLNDFVQRLN